MAVSSAQLSGGKGANQATAAVRAGASVQFLGSFGEDETGAVLRGRLRREGVGLTGSMTVSGPSGTAVVMVDQVGENVVIVPPGANDQLRMTEIAGNVIERSDVLLCQLEVPLSAAGGALRTARKGGVVTIVNASPVTAKPVFTELLGLADVVVVNEGEADELGSRLADVPHVVSTLGARGASYQGPDSSFDVPAPAVEPVDTTGAGDVFAGVLAASWHLGPEQALNRAVVAGALATLVEGAGDCAPTAQKIEQALSAR
jgi:ribokinase